MRSLLEHVGGNTDGGATHMFHNISNIEGLRAVLVPVYVSPHISPSPHPLSLHPSLHPLYLSPPPSHPLPPVFLPYSSPR